MTLAPTLVTSLTPDPALTLAPDPGPWPRPCRSVERRDFGTAMTLLGRAEALCGAEAFGRRDAAELRAFVHAAGAFYYYRRGKFEAALDLAEKAMRTHVAMQVSRV